MLFSFFLFRRHFFGSNVYRCLLENIPRVVLLGSRINDFAKTCILIREKPEVDMKKPQTFDGKNKKYNSFGRRIF